MTQNVNAFSLIDRLVWTNYSIDGYVKHKEVAIIIIEQFCDQLAAFALACSKRAFRIFCEGEPPFEIDSKLSTRREENIIMPSNVPSLEIPELEIDLNELYIDPNPIYITDLETQSVIFCNYAALCVQGAKPTEMASKLSAWMLNHPDELISRDNLLRNNKRHELKEYDYRAFRWQKDDKNIFYLKEMNFISDFKLINFLGVNCRFGKTLIANPISVEV